MRRSRRIAGGVLALLFVGSSALASAPPGGNDFESPAVRAFPGVKIVRAGGDIGGSDLTFVVDGNVGLVRKNWIRPAQGKQSLDLNGTKPGRVCGEYDMNGPEGTRYRISFKYAGNPYGGPAVKTFEVEWNWGASIATFGYDTTRANPHKLSWRRGSVDLTGNGEMWVCFQSTTRGAFGPMLDDLKFVQLGR